MRECVEKCLGSLITHFIWIFDEQRDVDGHSARVEGCRIRGVVSKTQWQMHSLSINRKNSHSDCALNYHSRVPMTTQRLDSLENSRFSACSSHLLDTLQRQKQRRLLATRLWSSFLVARMHQRLMIPMHTTSVS